MKMNKGFVLWFTGLPCSGKTTIAKTLKKEIENKYKVIHIDGDDFRKTPFANDLGFSEEDRKKNIKRASYLCKMFMDEGYIVLASFVSPTNNIREIAVDIVGRDAICFVQTNSSPQVCAQRDVKGMWAKAKKGEIKDFTGYDAPFEVINILGVPIYCVNTEDYDVSFCIKELKKVLHLQIKK